MTRSNHVKTLMGTPTNGVTVGFSVRRLNVIDWFVPREVAMHWNERGVHCEPHSVLNISRACCTLRQDINSDSSVNGCCHIDVTVKREEKTVSVKAERKHTMHCTISKHQSTWGTLLPEWIRLHNQEFYDLYSSTNIIRVIQPTIMRRDRHVARMKTEEVHTGFWCGNPRERDHLKDLGVDGE
jgi:hypothetical protein